MGGRVWLNASHPYFYSLAVTAVSNIHQLRAILAFPFMSTDSPKNLLPFVIPVLLRVCNWVRNKGSEQISEIDASNLL